MRIAFIFSAWLLSFSALAAPNDVATLDRSTWPEQLTTPTLFDVASRAEILTFARALLVSEALGRSVAEAAPGFAGDQHGGHRGLA